MSPQGLSVLTPMATLKGLHIGIGTPGTEHPCTRVVIKRLRIGIGSPGE